MSISTLIHAKPYEQLILPIRRHWVTFVPYILLYSLLILLPLTAYFVLGLASSTLMQNTTVVPLVILSASIYYLCITLFMYSYFVTFYLDLTVITNDRMVDIEQNSLFSRTVAEVDLYQIQDATSEVKGLFPSLFDYGNIFIQTAGTIPKFTLHNVPHPDELRQKILDLSAQDKIHHNA